jgi:hypothetical protein
MKNAVFWNVTQCGSCRIRLFGGVSHFHHQGNSSRLAKNVRSNWQPKHAAKKSKRFPLLVAANVVSSSSIVVTLMLEMIFSPETSILTRVAQCNILEDEILHLGSDFSLSLP